MFNLLAINVCNDDPSMLQKLLMDETFIYHYNKRRRALDSVVGTRFSCSDCHIFFISVNIKIAFSSPVTMRCIREILTFLDRRLLRWGIRCDMPLSQIPTLQNFEFSFDCFWLAEHDTLSFLRQIPPAMA